MFRILILTLILLVAGCHPYGKKPEPRPPEPPTEEAELPPAVYPPAIPERPLKPNPEAMPKGATAVYPAFDGEGFTVTLPAGQADRLSAKEVFATVVAPALKAIGMENPEEHMRVPDYDGREFPRANLASLAAITCREVERLENPRWRRICGALVEGQADSETDRLFQAGEGMTFAQYQADIERLEIEYFFPQVAREVPIEHTGIIAARWQGETITLVTGRAFTRYRVVNSVVLTPEEAGRRLASAVIEVDGVCCPDRKPPERIELLLLPYGESEGLPALRYVYRMPVRAYWGLAEGFFYAWLDAEDGTIRQLEPLVYADVNAGGRTFRRAPDLLPSTNTRSFRVDDSVGGQYTLGLTGVFSRLDRFGDGVYDDGEVSIPDNANGSTPTFANFNQAPLNDAASAVCASGGNSTFQQVDLMATLQRHRQSAISAGLFTPFPNATMNISFENAFCNAFGSPAGLSFGTCAEYSNASCPDGANQWLVTTHDHTWVAHELGHALTPRQYTDRPADWCVGPTVEGIPLVPCPVPVAPGSIFHDFADSWAHALENTNCWSGWFAKNQGGGDASLNCIANHSEGGSAPRLSQVDVPFDATNPGDHFPEHRTLSTSPYANAQIAGAALWALRQGMRSKCLPSGTPQYFVRFVRALRTTGWFGAPVPTNTDRGVYRGLVDLGLKIANQWATSGSPGGPPAFHHNGPHTTNKAVGGFARAGIFLIPWQCLDGSNATTDPGFCPTGENGGDAVVDIDDNDAGDDITVEGAGHLALPEWDYLERGGTPPTFHVWTGPAYRFSGTNAAFSNPAPCNTQYQVEIANNDTFTDNLTVSGFLTVDVDPTDGVGPDCYDSWTPTPAQWDVLDDADRLFYRVRTRDGGGMNEKVSTSPGNGLFSPPPPYAVINTSGTP